jgi:hypothetical protein
MEMQRDEATAARLQRVAEIEAQIDPSLRRRGRIVADLVTIAIVTPLAIAFDFHVTRPLALLVLVGAALALNRLVPIITERRLRADRTRLLAAAESPRAETNRDPDVADPPSRESTLGSVQ